MIKLTEKKIQQIIKEEAEKFLDEPYDERFDLVLENITNLSEALPRADRMAQERAQRAALAKGGDTDEPLPDVRPTWKQKLGGAAAATKKAAGAAGAATKKGLDKFRASDINQKGGEAAINLGKRAASGIAKAGIGTLGAAGKGVGAALGGLAKGAMGAFQTKTPMQKLAKAHKKARKAGLDNQTILQLGKLLQSGALSEKQIATIRLTEKCLKSGKVKIVKEEKDPIIIDV